MLPLRFTRQDIRLNATVDGYAVHVPGRKRAYLGRLRIPYWLALRLR